MSGKKKQRKLRNRRNNRRQPGRSPKKEATQELATLSRELVSAGQNPTMLDHLTARPLRRATLLQMQQEHGNAYVQRVLDSQENIRRQAADIQLEDEASTDESKSPELEETGIGSEVAMDRFVSTARGIKDNWASYKTGKERAKALGDAANEELQKAGVPATKLRVKKLGPGLQGQLTFSTWTLLVSSTLFEKDTASDDEMANAADTIYHEARHAEQWFRMAQLMASQGKNAKQIVAKMGIPYKIAKAAFKDPLKADSPQKAGAESWYESVYGAKAKHRDKTLTELSKLSKLVDKAKKAYLKYEKTVKARVKQRDKLKVKLDKEMEKQTKAMVDWIVAPEGKDKATEAKLKKVDKRVAAYEKAVEKADQIVDKANAVHKKLLETLKKVRDKRKKLHKDYMELPEEADAWKVGEAVQEEMKIIVIEIDLTETESE